MHKFFIKTPWWVKRFFSSYVWHIPTNEKTVYLSFDDGPHPTITPWVLDQLKLYDAKATFFCIGNNVQKHTHFYKQIIEEGHAIGNHTYHHLNGWQTDVKKYLDDVSKASEIIDSNLFRPPYGRVKAKQAKGLCNAMKKSNVKLIMWDVLSADFDKSISPDKCAANVLQNKRPGSIIVFHDSEKAFTNLQHALPLVLKTLKEEGYRFEKIVMDAL